ncbi:MAG: alpha/beta fold hydrolase [Burkholderiaceae bacterium]
MPDSDDTAPPQQDGFIEAGGHRLEYRLIGRLDPARPALVFLHEGLGCIAMWRGFPARIAQAAGLPALVYSRHGYGKSDPLTEPRSSRFMHDEAAVALPAVLRAFGITQPILIGHSDGASIALIHAGLFPDGTRAAAVMAPHLFVEQLCIDEIARAAQQYLGTDMRARLARYHDDVDGAFHGWADVWLSPDFPAWTIEAEVAASRCPILAIQGWQDQYGTMRQIDRIAELRPDARLLKLDDCRHSPHLDRHDEVLAAIVSFVAASA